MKTLIIIFYSFGVLMQFAGIYLSGKQSIKAFIWDIYTIPYQCLKAFKMLFTVGASGLIQWHEDLKEAMHCNECLHHRQIVKRYKITSLLTSTIFHLIVILILK